MSTTAKLLIVGAPGGPQARFLSAISEVKVRSSARTPSGEGFVPMDFGRVRLGVDLDLQFFGIERDQVGLIADAVAPGIAGAIILMEASDVSDPHFAAQALDELSARGIVTVVGTTQNGSGSAEIAPALNLSAPAVIDCSHIDKESVKNAIIRLLEAAVEAAGESAA